MRPGHRGNKRTHLALISLSASGHCLLLLPRASLTLAKAAVHFNSTVCLSSDIQFIYCDQLLFFIAIITVEIVNTISCARVLGCKRGRSILMITVIIPVKVRSHACNGIQMFPPAPMKTLVLICKSCLVWSVLLYSSFKMMLNKKTCSKSPTRIRSVKGLYYSTVVWCCRITESLITDTLIDLVEEKDFTS